MRETGETTLTKIGIIFNYLIYMNLFKSEIDKQRKQKIKQQSNENTQTVEEAANHNPMQALPWILLVISWLGFVAYISL
jgi:hypothetical protein|tara:strand:- start:409 stop:645 length:237 start_codon:yes stop_codon:yes gene_type:complete